MSLDITLGGSGYTVTLIPAPCNNTVSPRPEWVLTGNGYEVPDVIGRCTPFVPGGGEGVQAWDGGATWDSGVLWS
jgi:hypothetical protein